MHVRGTFHKKNNSGRILDKTGRVFAFIHGLRPRTITLDAPRHKVKRKKKYLPFFLCIQSSTKRALNPKNEFYLPVVLICQVENIFHLGNHCQPLKKERSILGRGKNPLCEPIFSRYHEDKVSQDLKISWKKREIFIARKLLKKGPKGNPLYQILTSFFSKRRGAPRTKRSFLTILNIMFNAVLFLPRVAQIPLLEGDTCARKSVQNFLIPNVGLINRFGTPALNSISL